MAEDLVPDHSCPLLLSATRNGTYCMPTPGLYGPVYASSSSGCVLAVDDF